MIRSVLIFTYILIVLLVSGLARAEYAQVDHVAYDSSSHMLHIQGAFTNACQTHPRPVVIDQIEESGLSTVILGVSVEQDAESLCAAALTGRYDLVFDIRTLELPAGRELILKFKNSAASITEINARIENIVHGLRLHDVEATGLLVEMLPLGIGRNSTYAVVTPEKEVIHIQSLVDLSAYVNGIVRVAGIQLRHAAGPALEQFDIDFEKRKDLGTKPSLVFTTTISSAPLQ